MKPGVQLIAEERARQIGVEGYTREHDDAHDMREIAKAAQSYVNHYVGRAHAFANDLGLPGITPEKTYRKEPAPDTWPWSARAWNPQDPVRDLVKAGALIAAEIDRLQRAKSTEGVS